MSTVKFSDAETFAFIELYKKNSCLWDISSNYYKNSLLRKKAYALIGKEMCLDVAKVKTKINTLRSTYTSELKKVEQSIKSGEIYSPKLVWFKAMTFINENIIPRGKTVNDLRLDHNILSDGIHLDLKQESNKPDDKFEINFSSSCRICLQEVEKLDLKLLTERYHDMSYADLIIFCTGINLYIENTSFPLNLCSNCEETLLKAYDFKQQIIKSNYQLENLLATDLNGENYNELNNINTWCDDETITENSQEDIASSEHENVLKEVCNEQDTFMITKQKVVKKCYHCDLSFESLGELKNHKQVNHPKRNYKRQPELCLICGKLVFDMKKHTDTHKTSSERESFECLICNRVYKIKYNLTQHMILSHTNPNEFRYKCQFCDRKFRFWSNRKVHLFREHGEKARFICSVCNKEFYVKEKYKSHMRTHTGEKPYNCTNCDKTFRTLKQQRNHMIIHTNEKNHKCDICQKCFSRKRSLGEHMKIHTGEKNYICPVCTEAFIQNHVMRTHVTKKHPDYVLPPPGTITSIKAIKKLKKL